MFVNTQTQGKSLLTTADIKAMERHLMMTDPETVRAVLTDTSARRSYNRSANRGYVSGTQIGMRQVGNVPDDLVTHPRFRKFFDTKLPKDVRRETMYHFWREFSKLMVIDKL